MKQRRVAYVATVVLLSAACTTPHPAADKTQQSNCQVDLVRHERLHAVLWLQTAAEYKAAAEQAYAVAGMRLKNAVADASERHIATAAAPQDTQAPFAVIVDVDETIFNNSPEEARLVAKDKRKYDEEI